MVIACGFYESAEGQKAEQDIILATLRAFRQKGVNTPVLSSQIDVPGLSSDQVSGVVTALHEQNLLESSFVKRGYFSIQAYRLSHEGDDILNKAEGVNPVEADKAAMLRILRFAAEQDAPCLLSSEDIQQERCASLTRQLIGEGLLEQAPVKRGYFVIDGVQITGSGRDALAALDKKVTPRPDDLHA